MTPTHVLKRSRTHSEPFDPIKLHASIVAACLAVRTLEGEAHLAAERVSKHVMDWIAHRAEVTSEDIRRVASAHLQSYHAEAAYMYEHHRLIA